MVGIVIRVAGVGVGVGVGGNLHLGRRTRIRTTKALTRGPWREGQPYCNLHVKVAGFSAWLFGKVQSLSPSPQLPIANNSHASASRATVRSRPSAEVHSSWHQSEPTRF